MKEENVKEGNRALKGVSKLLGMKPRRVQFFSDQRGLLYKFVAHKRKGVAREYSDVNVIDLLLIKEMSNYGITISVISQVMAQFHVEIADWWDFNEKKFQYDNYRIIISLKDDSIRLRIAKGKKHFTVYAEQYTSALVVDIGALARDLGF